MILRRAEWVHGDGRAMRSTANAMRLRALLPRVCLASVRCNSAKFNAGGAYMPACKLRVSLKDLEFLSALAQPHWWQDAVGISSGAA